MATALAYPDKERGGRGKNSLIIKEYRVNEGYLSQARFVLRHCRDKAEEVLKNAKYPLTVAYEEAQEGQGFCVMAGLPDSGRDCSGGGGSPGHSIGMDEGFYGKIRD